MTAADLYAAQPEDDILYVDLREADNHSLRFGNDFLDVDAEDIFDGAVFFREVHPQAWKPYP